MWYWSLVVAEVREAVSVHKQSALKFVVERFDMNWLIEGNVREDYQLKITNSFAALENLKVDSMEISRAWENIRQQKMENHWVKVTWILIYINMQESHFMGYYCFFLIPFIWWVKHQENGRTVLPYLYTQKMVNKWWKIIV